MNVVIDGLTIPGGLDWVFGTNFGIAVFFISVTVALIATVVAD